MKITLQHLLAEKDQSYTPAPGHEYEIADGVWGTMKAPTAALIEKVGKRLGEPDCTDLEVCKIVLKGLPDELDENSILYGMPSKASADFFSMLRLIDTELLKYSRRFDQSEQGSASQE